MAQPTKTFRSLYMDAVMASLHENAMLFGTPFTNAFRKDAIMSIEVIVPRAGDRVKTPDGRAWIITCLHTEVAMPFSVKTRFIAAPAEGFSGFGSAVADGLVRQYGTASHARAQRISGWADALTLLGTGSWAAITSQSAQDLGGSAGLVVPGDVIRLNGCEYRVQVVTHVNGVGRIVDEAVSAEGEFILRGLRQTGLTWVEQAGWWVVTDAAMSQRNVIRQRGVRMGDKVVVGGDKRSWYVAYELPAEDEYGLKQKDSTGRQWSDGAYLQVDRGDVANLVGLTIGGEATWEVPPGRTYTSSVDVVSA